jgi:phage virion morphogenesis protein
MAGALVTVDARRVEAALAKLAAAATDVRPALVEIGNSLIQSHHRRFDQQVDAQGRRWAPLSPRYYRYKKKNKDRILVLDSFLRDFLHYQAEQDRLDFGASQLYAATHQFGDPSRNIPARPYLGISNDDEREIVEILSEHLSRALR